MRKDIIFTTWASKPKLYQMMSSLLDANVIPIDASPALQYFMSALTIDWGNIKWLVHLDEDAFLFDLKRLYDLIDYMEDNNFDVAGIPDGGVIEMRGNNPLSINPFFSIFRYDKIRKILHQPPSLSFECDDLIEDNLSSHLFKKGLSYNSHGTSESYYPLFFKLLREGCKFLYLDGLLCKEDNLSTYILDMEKEPFLVHTWFARRYNSEIKGLSYPKFDTTLACSEEFNSQRINAIFEKHKSLELAKKEFKKQYK